jgi:pimeloyl-ACP methyl ester carboxylesterase
MRGNIMRKSLTVISVAILALLILLAGCYEPGGPVPEEAHPTVPRDYTQEQVDEVVVMEERVIEAPLPDEWGAPDVCDEIHFLRFRLADGSTLDPANAQGVNAATTDAMLVMLPGVLEGANGFEYLGRQMVYMAKIQDGLNLEVWAVERRNNRLEDLSAANHVEAALKAGDINVDEATQILIDYYYNGEELNGRTFDGWYKDADLPFLSEFGLELDTQDVFAVIQAMVPDLETRKQKVFVGGHSMGGMMTSMFAGWDLDGDPATTDDAGYNNCAGLFGFDTLVSSVEGFLDLFLGALPEGLITADMTESMYATLLDSLRNDPDSNRILPFPMLDAEAMALLEAISILADWAPDQECTAIREVPFSDSIGILLRFLFSRDLGTYMDGTPLLTDFRLTNEAMLGVVFDDSFAPVGMIQNSMGFLGGGAVVAKDFPMSESLAGIPILGDMLGGFLGTGPYFIANDAGPSAFALGQGPLYHWVDFDEVGTESDPLYQDTEGVLAYTEAINEVADIQDVARVIYAGPTNLVEWYFSTRLIADQMAAMFGFGPKYGINFLHGDDLEALPKIEFIAGQGMMGDSMGEPPPNCIRLLLDGYNHMDVLTASANTTTRRPNEVIRPLIDFVKDNL